MNSKVAALLLKASKITKKPYPYLKKAWLATPRNQRGDLREALETLVMCSEENK